MSCHSHGDSREGVFKRPLVAIAGAPNSGKSTLFNRLTGMRQKTTNFPGTTVSLLAGTARVDGHVYTIVDLPGMYGTTPVSQEEEIALRFLLTGSPDTVVVILDSSSPGKSLHLVLELASMGLPMVVVANKADLVGNEDVLKRKMVELSELLGVPVVIAVASRGLGIGKVKGALLAKPPRPRPYRFRRRDVEDAVEMLEREVGRYLGNVPFSRWVAEKLLLGNEFSEKVARWLNLPHGIVALGKDLGRRLEEKYGTAPEVVLASDRFSFITEFLRGLEKRGESPFVERLDQLLLHPLTGFAFFLLVLYTLYLITFEVSIPVQDFLQDLVSAAVSKASMLGQGFWARFLAEGVVGSVGLVASFVPVVFIFMLLLGLLEDSGYMARAAVATSRLVSKFGLHGKSVAGLMTGFGCNVPAIYATRILEGWRERFATLVAIPFVPCSARLVVIAFLAAAFFPQHQAEVSMAVILVSILLSLAAAWVGSRLSGTEPVPLVIELPPLSIPSLRNSLLYSIDLLKEFLLRAGTIIAGSVALLWLLGNWPRPLGEGSLLDGLGMLLEPLGRPIGLDWRGLVALIVGIVAKENVVSTLSVLYSPSMEEIRMLLTPLQGLVMMTVSAIYIPCLSTMVALWREGGLRTLVTAVSLSLVSGYLVGMAVYTIGSMLGVP